MAAPLLTYAWTVRNAAEQTVASGNSSSFAWDTSGVTFGPEIFLDGFESGSTGAWNGSGFAGTEPFGQGGPGDGHPGDDRRGAGHRQRDNWNDTTLTARYNFLFYCTGLLQTCS